MSHAGPLRVAAAAAVPSADGLVGPPVTGIGRRSAIVATAALDAAADHLRQEVP